MKSLQDSYLYFSEMSNTNRWFYETVRPFLGNRVLEVGGGVGNITKFLVEKEFVLVLEKDPHFIKILEDKFSSYPNIKVKRADIEKFSEIFLLDYNFDTVLCSNVLEHIEDDRAVLNGFYGLLPVGGKCVLVVPAHNWLYCDIDRCAGHVRRYGEKEIISKLQECNFYIHCTFYLNFFGVLGWFFNGKVLRRSVLSTNLLGIYESLVPLFKFLEGFITPPLGLSLVVVCKKMQL